VTSEQFADALDAIRAGLAMLAALDVETMPKQTDLAYQRIAARGAELAVVIGHEDLWRLLQVAALTCHSCGDGAPT
jgi:hypothetical protein